MGKHGKFIDKHAATTRTYRLVHRDQRDPLAADPDAPSLVLVPAPTAQQRKRGITYDPIVVDVQKPKGPSIDPLFAE